jgi:hypothetical protein
LLYFVRDEVVIDSFVRFRAPLWTQQDQPWSESTLPIQKTSVPFCTSDRVNDRTGSPTAALENSKLLR